MSLVRRNNSLFPSFFDEVLKPDWFGGIENFSSSVPAVNIKEEDNKFSLEVAAPGMKKEDFNVEIDKNILTVSADVKKESEEKDSKENARYSRKEFSYTSFKRIFTLPETVDSDKINATYEDGVLVLALPKKEEALPKPKRLIEIA
ncbi:Hsp20/alpha crystallin family protein [Galbibacter pacificus]|uniref:Hsp20/alpha crystallin family protein n=1 Tax=Galbibacter pacificus TaxID=2996052 RepID=A0ABT6FV15_9FLAO|nr:Hsp20/alpha crystallin family protein [Galbibacter pacificus]MDG3583582.1 Hsp20/alpha crystallin family protein [Galbibacter pacificus]MDG3586942.1 Hsp20/alpha crystallin family protein [Galbibacter pacificus]